MIFIIFTFLAISFSLSNGTLVKNLAIKFIGDTGLEGIVSQECLDKIQFELKVCQDKSLEYLEDPEYISLVKEYQDAINSGNLEQIKQIKEKMWNFSCCEAWKSLRCLKDALKVLPILFAYLFIVCLKLDLFQK